MRAYDLLLVIRAQNQASQAIRRASSDLGGLNRIRSLQSQAQQISNARSQNNLQRQRLITTQNIATETQRSLTTGPRAIAQQQRINAATEKQGQLLKQHGIAHEALTGNLAEQEATMKRMAELNAAGALKPPGSQEWANTNEQFKTASTHLEDLKLKEQNFRSAVDTSNKALSEHALQIQKVTEMGIANNAALGVSTEHFNTATDAEKLKIAADKEFAASQALVNRQTEIANTFMGRYGQTLEHVGRVSQLAGLGITATAGYAAYQAAQFQTGGVLAATQMITRSRNSVAQIQSTGAYNNQAALAFLASGKSVVSAADVQAAQYAIPSGIPSLRGNSIQKAKETIGLIKEFNQVVKANYGLVDLNGVTNAGIILINTFGTSLGRLPHEFDVMQSAVNRGKITMGEFVQGLSKTAPAAKAAGYSFDDMAATMSFLSGKLPQYTVATAGYARALDLFHNEKFIAYMKANGAAVTDTHGRLLAYNQIIKEMLKVDPQLATKQSNLIGFLKTATGTQSTIQARRVLTVSLTDLAGLNRATTAVPANAAGLVNASATALSATGAVKWKELTTELKAFVIELGQGALPAFQAIAKPIEYLMKLFNGLSPSTKQLVGEIVAITGVLALLGGTLISVIGGIGSFVVGLKLISAERLFSTLAVDAGKGGSALKIAGEDAGFASVEFAAVLGPLALLALGLWKFHSQTMTVVNGLGGLGHVLSGIGLIFASWKIFKAIQGIDAITAAATAATAETGALGGALAGLAGMGPILIPITMLISYEYAKGFLGAKGRSFGVKVLSGVSRLGNFLAGQGSTFPGLKFVGDVTQQIINATKPSALSQETGVSGAAAITGAAAVAARHGETSPVVLARIAAAARTVRANKLLGQTAGAPFNLQTAIAHIDALQAKELRTKSYADIKAYYDAVALLQSHYTGTALQAVNQLLSATGAATKKAANQTASDMSNILQNATSAYNSLYQQNQTNFGALFAGPWISGPRQQNRIQWGGKLTGGDILKDIKSQVFQFREFNNLVSKIAKRGAPPELINQLLAAGPAAIQEVRDLANMPKSQFKQYTQAFNQGQALLHKTTIDQLTSQLKDYRKYGQDMALSIIAGVQDKRVGLTNELRKLIAGIFGVDPSKLGKTGVGGIPVSGRVGGVHETHTHLHVTAPGHHPSIATQARHGLFAMQQKYRHR